jgi:hypothetical protein
VKVGEVSVHPLPNHREAAKDSEVSPHSFTFHRSAASLFFTGNVNSAPSAQPYTKARNADYGPNISSSPARHSALPSMGWRRSITCSSPPTRRARKGVQRASEKSP